MALIKHVCLVGLCVILAAICVMATGFDDKSYLVTLDYVAGQITAHPVTTANLPSGYRADHTAGDYSLQLKSQMGTILVTKHFAFPLHTRVIALPTSTSADIVGAEGRTLTQATARVSVPYYSEAIAMDVYGLDGTLKTTLDVSQYLRCNQNRVCDDALQETPYLCPEDCGGTVTEWTWLYVVLAVAGLFLIMPLLKRRRR